MSHEMNPFFLSSMCKNSSISERESGGLQLEAQTSFYCWEQPPQATESILEDAREARLWLWIESKYHCHEPIITAVSIISL